MPYVDHAAHREYVVEEYPKMLTEKDKEGHDRPVLYPAGHVKQGLPVIFENADEERAYSKPAAKKVAAKKDTEYGHPVRD